jgi:hypothetical protein
VQEGILGRTQEGSIVKCTHFQYLEEKMVECLRVAKSANDGTPAQEEWLKTAEALFWRKKEHLKVCKACGGK